MATNPRSVTSASCDPSALLGGASLIGCGPTAIATWLHFLFDRLKNFFSNYVRGGMAKAPTTASTQATGAAGATVVNVDILTGVVVVNGSQLNIGEADRVLHDTTVYTGEDSGAGTSTLTTTDHLAKITVVAKSSSATFGSGTVSLVNVKGATHATAAVECTDAEIQTKVGAGLPWVKLALVSINRTGDTTITQTQDNSVRPALGINVDSDFFGTSP